jgi:hypothetical protein
MKIAAVAPSGGPAVVRPVLDDEIARSHLDRVAVVERNGQRACDQPLQIEGVVPVHVSMTLAAAVEGLHAGAVLAGLARMRP